jgi:hypothetical protein
MLFVDPMRLGMTPLYGSRHLRLELLLTTSTDRFNAIIWELSLRIDTENQIVQCIEFAYAILLLGLSIWIR